MKQSPKRIKLGFAATNDKVNNLGTCIDQSMCTYKTIGMKQMNYISS